LLVKGDISFTVEQPPAAAAIASARVMDRKVLVDLMTNPYRVGHL
jgi:hypothetical protein